MIATTDRQLALTDSRGTTREPPVCRRGMGIPIGFVGSHFYRARMLRGWWIALVVACATFWKFWLVRQRTLRNYMFQPRNVMPPKEGIRLSVFTMRPLIILAAL